MADILIKAPGKEDYEVIIEKDFSRLNEKLASFDIANKKVCIVSDSTVFPIYGEEVKGIFEKCCKEISTLILEVGEVSKSLEDVGCAYKLLLDRGFNRSDYIVALGGGVVGDYSGFVAATYKRGMNFIQIPTSLQAMVDSSIGGKVGIDYENYQNHIGAFKQPKLVYSNAACLNTLDDIQFYSGFAQAMKYAIIKSSSVYEWLIDKLYEISDKDIDVLCDMIEQTVNIKKIYIEKDPFDLNGDRALLNLGQTVGNALERSKNYNLTHGECTALGIIAAAHISLKRNMLSLEEYLEIRDMFVPFNLPITVEDIDFDDILNNIKADKKQSEDGLAFILLKKIGKAVICRDVSDEEITEALKELRYEETND